MGLGRRLEGEEVKQSLASILESQCIVLLQEVGGLHCLYMSFPENSAISVHIMLFQQLWPCFLLFTGQELSHFI